MTLLEFIENHYWSLWFWLHLQSPALQPYQKTSRKKRNNMASNLDYSGHKLYLKKPEKM